MSRDDNLTSTQILERIPLAMGDLAVQACLLSFPVALLTYTVSFGLLKEGISIRNEMKIKKVLISLKGRIEELEKNAGLKKEELLANAAYQEVAQKRLLSISSVLSEEDLELSAQLISICSMLDFDSIIDRKIVHILSEISLDEVKIFLNMSRANPEYEDIKKNMDEIERRDAAPYESAQRKIIERFRTYGEEVTALDDIIPVISKIASYGLLNTQRSVFDKEYTPEAKLYLPAYSTIGVRLSELLSIK